MENKIHHLQMIQGVVSRLSQNSFLIKGWVVVLVAALFALAAPQASVAFTYLAYIPAVMFWGLDGYFLWQERLFRDLYDHVRTLDETAVDFSMDTSSFAKKQTWANAAMSKALWAFHGALLLSIIVVMVLLLYGFGGTPSGT